MLPRGARCGHCWHNEAAGAWDKTWALPTGAHADDLGVASELEEREERRLGARLNGDVQRGVVWRHLRGSGGKNHGRCRR